MATLDDVLDVTIDRGNVDEGAFKIIQVVRPEWKAESVQKSALEEGTVNLMFKYWDTRFDDAIVVRVFGDGLSGYLSKDEEVKACRMLAHIGSAPKLLTVFKNGYCSEFVKGRIYSITKNGEAEADIKLAKAVVREIATFHCQKTAKLTKDFRISQDGGHTYSITKRVMEDWGPNLMETLPIMKSPEFPSKDEVQSEIDKMIKMVEGFNMPLVYCHCDLHPGNAIYDEENDKATLVDFEFCSFFYSGFDLAFYLFYSAFGLGTRPSPEPPQMHPVEYQREFVREYLEALSRLDSWSHDVTDEEVEQLRRKVEVFMLLIMLLHIPFLLVIAGVSSVMEEEESQSIAWGCLKAWKLYLKSRKETLGY